MSKSKCVKPLTDDKSSLQSRDGFHCGALARSLTRCWFVQQIHWKKEQQRRLLKKSCTCTCTAVPAQAQTCRRRDRHGSVRGDRSPAGRKGEGARVRIRIWRARCRNSSRSCHCDWWPRPPRSMRTSRRNQSRRAPNHYQTPPPPCSGILNRLTEPRRTAWWVWSGGPQRHHREVLPWAVAASSSVWLRRAVARVWAVTWIERDDANVRRSHGERNHRRRLPRVRLKMRAYPPMDSSTHGHRHLYAKEDDCVKEKKKHQIAN